jgi:hypothetical protein
LWINAGYRAVTIIKGKLDREIGSYRKFREWAWRAAVGPDVPTDGQARMAATAAMRNFEHARANARFRTASCR